MTHQTFLIHEEFAYPEAITDVIEGLNTTPTEEIINGVTPYTDKNGSRLVLAHPKKNADFNEALEASGKALVFDYPFANGDFPWKRVQTQYLSELTNQPVIGIASPGTDGSSYKFSSSERRSIARNGDFRPYSERGLQAIDRVFDVGRLSFIGWSQGGNIALNRADVATESFDVDSVVAGDPTSAENRGLAKLFGDLSAAGYDKLEEELNQAQLKALLETLGYSEENKKSDLHRTLHYGKSIASAPYENLLVAKGLGRRSLSDDLLKLINADVRIVLGHGKESRIAKHESIGAELKIVNDQLAANGIEWRDSGLRVVEFEGTTHAGGDNVKKLGLLALVAMGRLTFPN